MEQFSYELDFLLSLVLSLSLELATLLVLARFSYFQDFIQKGTLFLIFTGTIATSLTLPYLWFVLPAFFTERWTYLLFGEIAVTILESLVFMHLLERSFIKAFLASVICNSFSYSFGLLL